LALHQIIVLALIQGLTEFLPISSSGHLIIIPELLKWYDQGLEMDVAVHIGTLGAVLFYFWKDVWRMITGTISLLRGKVDQGSRMALFLVIATIPAVIFGTLISAYGTGGMRTIAFVGWTTLIFGILLHIADQTGSQDKSLKDMNGLHAIMVGLAQAVALLPGTSRSGICMTMSRFLGFKRPEAARFSFLLSIPAIIAAATHTSIKMYKAHQGFLQKDMLIAAGIALIVGLLAINFMLKWLQRSDFKPFVFYRIILGSGLLAYAYLT
jgi:undecaprenyl-diphosphatase